MGGSARFITCFVVVAPLIYGLALACEYGIEQPGIRLGKRVNARLG